MIKAEKTERERSKTEKTGGEREREAFSFHYRKAFSTFGPLAFRQCCHTHTVAAPSNASFNEKVASNFDPKFSSEASLTLFHNPLTMSAN